MPFPDRQVTPRSRRAPGPRRPAGPPGLTFVPGMELSCRLDGRSLHLLAYLFDPAHPGLTAETASIREDRVRRARAMVAKLAALGAGVTWECGCHSRPARCFHAGRLSALPGYGIFPAHVLSVTAVTAARSAGGNEAG